RHSPPHHLEHQGAQRLRCNRGGREAGRGGGLPCCLTTSAARSLPVPAHSRPRNCQLQAAARSQQTLPCERNSRGRGATGLGGIRTAGPGGTRIGGTRIGGTRIGGTRIG
ncbi:hypothetical protein PMAYCL1PPCAC_21869, partial [Pristionchus mayeri]